MKSVDTLDNMRSTFKAATTVLISTDDSWTLTFDVKPSVERSIHGNASGEQATHGSSFLPITPHLQSSFSNGLAESAFNTGL